ncbi:acyl-[ACP]--phospholipid O-acyltransferase [Bartonella tamiae]|uniref:Phospholipid/glycerol acyltransferase domain-containing protein n=1 Tax=Bartonella tamiae Th239 TaxID=1094558 RepID=J1K0Y0_9HYPH|nr:acyl-[ACP]--phospholipid O-acyltransferase [Bartonella tamiae]EJF91092.1 hypothetical protein ME5_00424 [Bartonella tamiae Th239]EJF93243.1 hypothetical protein MEG_01457 [Bartonella tamiae Th307]
MQNMTNDDQFIPAHDTSKLMRSRRFAPLFWTQFFSAFNDNFVKNTLVFLILSVVVLENQPALITLAGGVFSLPFLLLSATGGQMADRFDKAVIARYIKFAEIFVTVLAAIALLLSSVTLMMCTLFLFGVGSALFGPVKYAILPEQMNKEQLPKANAWVESATFIAILAGTLFAGLTFGLHNGPQYLPALLMLILAILSWWTSRLIPLNQPAKADLKVDPNIARATFSLLKILGSDKRLFIVALMVSWFWFVGAMLLSVMPAMTNLLGGYHHGFTLFLTVFAICIALGSAIAAWLSAGRIVLLQSVVGTFICGLATIDLGFAIRGLDTTFQVTTFQEFLAHPGLFRITFDLALAAISGAFLVVPGFAALQAWAKRDERARVIAANNILNSAIMAIGAALVAYIQYLGVALDVIVIGLGIASLIASAIMLKFMPTNGFRDFVSILFRAFFRLEVKGMDNFAQAGDTPILALNHVSLLDGLLALAVCETTGYKNPAFAINSEIARRWWVRPFLLFINAYPMNPTRPLAARRLIHKVNEGSPLVIFPEGRISVTGALMKVYDGAAMVADKTQSKVVPIKIDGLERTFFSRLSGIQTRRSLFPKVRVTITKPVKFNLDPELKGRKRRQAAGNELYRIMSDLVFTTSGKNGTLFEELVKSAHNYGRHTTIIEDPLNGSMNYGKMLTSIRALGVKLHQLTQHEKTVGVLLPNSNVTAIMVFALQSAGKIPSMLNFSVGLATMQAATKAAQIQTIVTAKAFLRQARLEETAEKLSQTGIRFIYLDELKTTFTLKNKVAAFIWRNQAVDKSIKAQDGAVILFTSGSEGTPKGVVLTHANILANAAQCAARIDFNRSDKLFNVLPMFHSFGLTAGTILPLIYGVPIYFYPSPLHYRVVPEAIYSSNATIIFGTDTFLNGYGRNAHPYDLRSIRYCFAGAEPVKASTREMMMNKFGIRILEGYGVTETSPVLAINTPMYNKAGSVGKLLPGITARLEPVEGVEEGGRLYVKGPNIMAGYLTIEKPGTLLPPHKGWHDTGDIVDIDDQGFVTILGRAKRFAKIGGEMVSLSAVEILANQLWPEAVLAVVSIHDERKGERLILISEDESLSRAPLLKYARENGVAEINIPSKFIHASLPLLGTGKIDYVTLKKIAENQA